MAHQGEGLSRLGHQGHVHVHAHVHEGLSRDQDDEAGHYDFVVIIVAHLGHQRSPGQEAEVQENEDGGAPESRFFHDETEHVVSEDHRNLVLLGAVADSLPQDAAFLDGQHGAHRLVQLGAGLEPFRRFPFAAEEYLHGGVVVIGDAGNQRSQAGVVQEPHLVGAEHAAEGQDQGQSHQGNVFYLQAADEHHQDHDAANEQGR